MIPLMTPRVVGAKDTLDMNIKLDINCYVHVFYRTSSPSLYNFLQLQGNAIRLESFRHGRIPFHESPMPDRNPLKHLFGHLEAVRSLEARFRPENFQVDADDVRYGVVL